MAHCAGTVRTHDDKKGSIVMKNMKRVLILVLALIMAFGVVEAASAASINFTFNNITETVNTKSIS